MEKDHLTIILEDIQGKFELVLEGHDAIRREFNSRFDEMDEKIEMNTMMIQALNRKIDTVDERLSAKIDDVETRLSAKIDAVASDLAAHRADTESHGKRLTITGTA